MLCTMDEIILGKGDYPPLLANIPGAPKQLQVKGSRLVDLANRPFVGVVGSRKLTDYGREVTKILVSELARSGVVIVSGLALGIDSVAHLAAIKAGGITIAVLPSTIDNIYPASHHGLARRIIDTGGSLISEYSATNPPNKGSFVARNRIISGLCLGLLITEAAEKSGSLHTANFALEQGREVMVVPGSIFSPSSRGTNNLLKAGASPITSVQDIINCLGLEETFVSSAPIAASPEEAKILEALFGSQADTQTLFEVSQLPISIFNQTLTTLEITGKIARSGQTWTVLS
jgi:DNA processing protein